MGRGTLKQEAGVGMKAASRWMAKAPPLKDDGSMTQHVEMLMVIGWPF